MNTISKGKIFLADQRSRLATTTMLTNSTFNFGGTFNSSKVPFDRLFLLNEETLLGGQQTSYKLDRDSHIIILPITGDVNFNNGELFKISTEECLTCFVSTGGEFCLRNPFENDAINYLVIGLSCEKNTISRPLISKFDLSIVNQLNQINKPKAPFKLCIGRFDGRAEAAYPLADNAKLIAFNIGGAFEIDGRLLHEKDGLALWDTTQIEIESLSNNAVLLTLEIF